MTYGRERRLFLETTMVQQLTLFFWVFLLLRQASVQPALIKHRMQFVKFWLDIRWHIRILVWIFERFL
jgi:hypothetical protein